MKLLLGSGSENGWRLRALICLTFMHTLVDACALLITPLWPTLDESFQLGKSGLAFAFIIQAIPTSLSQAIFGALRDRISTPVFLWLGPLTAVLLLTLVGYPTNFGLLCFLLVGGGIGVGAFHPEAAVTVGKLYPESRARVLSIFMLGGTLGLCLGPLLSSYLVDRFGLESLGYLLPVFLMLLVILLKVGRLNSISKLLQQEEQENLRVVQEISNEQEQSSTADPANASANGVESAWGKRTIGLMLAMLVICSLRLIPNQALDKVIAFHMTELSYSTAEIGQVQSLFLASASVGMILMAAFFRTGWEKAFMVLAPLVSAPMLWVMGQDDCSIELFIGLLIPVGIVLWGTGSAMVSYGQFLFPKGAGLASALTMGISWGVASLCQSPITSHFKDLGNTSQACVVFVIPVLLSSFLALFLPKSSA